MGRRGGRERDDLAHRPRGAWASRGAAKRRHRDAGARDADFAARRRGAQGALTGFARDGGNRQPVEPDDRLSAVGTTSSTRRFRSEEHTSELQSLMRISYAVFCLKKKHTTAQQQHSTNHNCSYALPTIL